MSFQKVAFPVVCLCLAMAAQSMAQDIWIPPGVKVLRGLGVSMDNKPKDPTPNSQHIDSYQLWKFGHISLEDKDAGSREKVLAALKRLAVKSGHPEVEHLPFVNHGFSYSSCMANNLAKLMPERFINLSSSGCGGMGSSESAEDPFALMPAVYVAQTGDFYAKSMNLVFGPVRFHQARWTLAVQGGNHAYAQADVIFKPWNDHVIRMRLPEDWDPLKGPPSLKTIPFEEGWYGFRDENWIGGPRKFPRIEPVAGYSGDANNATFLPNEYLARVWQAFMSGHGSPSISEPAMPSNRWYGSSEFGQDIVVRVQHSGGRLDLYDGDVLIGSKTSGPYEFTITNPAPGVHVFIAHAISAQGEIAAVSYPRGILVKETGTSIRLTEPTGARLPANASATLKAHVEGSAEEVRFYSGSNLLGTAASSPFAFSWTPSDTGVHIITAEAKSGSQLVRSMPRKITVHQPSKPVSLLVRPGLEYVQPGKVVAFTAELYDQYGFAYPTRNVSWSVSEGGAIDGNGRFTAGSRTSGAIVVSATAEGVTGRATVAVTNRLRVNFGPTFIQVDGFLPDGGGAYGPKDKGWEYGWVADNGASGLGAPAGVKHGRVREINTEQVTWTEASHVNMTEQVEVPWNKTWVTRAWEAAVTNGKYTVTLAAGDATPRYDLAQLQNHTRTTHFVPAVLAEGVVVVRDTAHLDNPILTRSAKVEVTDGKLTLRSGYPNPGKDCEVSGVPPHSCRERMNKLAWVEIVPEGEPELNDVLSLRSRLPGATTLELTGGSWTLSGKGFLRLTVWDTRGRRLLSSPLGTGTVQLPTHGLQPGLYLLRADSQEGTVTRRFLLK